MRLAEEFPVLAENRDTKTENVRKIISVSLLRRIPDKARHM